ncbi:Transcriptional repressor AdcR [uncultured Eubacterium sp.]|uniref:MarR family winged helix-turn-helix transcriptional regulator n=1 Tax=Brotomerdimonas butyrica TaxID=2981721 RepID=UPI000821E706|nr:MarR family transcriptional regulator [Brotomerdimonas butyrica]MCU6756608.1 MarR family transcriptional regulator [Brotomerdimonas butyrica]SCH92958.1 Transcriptional repressor AdcR [uncultured Eubacterium sp.]
MNLKKALDSFYYSTALCNLRLMNEKFVDEHITYNSLLYLELIFTMKGECTVSRIADLLNISRPGVTLKVNELIKQGLVTKTPDPDDRRKNYLTVNEEAVPQYKIYRYQDNEAVRRITEKYSVEEIRMFCDMLDMISEINFEELKGE